jgi:hypothetical protein
LDPVNAVINRRIDDLVKAGGVSATLIKPIQDLKTFISRGINANWVKSALSFFEDVSQATEALDYELDQRNLSLRNSAISVRGMAIINPEKDLRLVDITACGMNGKATRLYERMD